MTALPCLVASSPARRPAPQAPAASPEELERLGEEIAGLAADLHTATYRLLVRLREFDAGEGWNAGCLTGGFLSCAHWLSWRTGIDLGAAREKVRVARALASLPRLGRALEVGELSYSKVRALTRIATPDNEAELLELARHATASQVETLVRAWRRADRSVEAESEARRHEARYLTVRVDEDGSYVVRGRLDPEVGALFERALERATVVLMQGESHAAPLVDGSPRADREAGTGTAAAGLASHAEATVGSGADWTVASGADGTVASGADGMVACGADETVACGAEVTMRPVSPMVRQVSPSTDPCTAAQRRADAFGLLIELALANSGRPSLDSVQEASASNEGREAGGAEAEPGIRGASATTGDASSSSGRPDGAGAVRSPRVRESLRSLHRVQLVLHVDADALRDGSETGQSVLDGGVRVSAETSRRLACDAERVVMTHDGSGRMLDVGRSRRTVPVAIRRALDARDRGCRFPGCTNRITDAHHVRHWADGGATRLDNLLLLCRRHHRVVHESGYRVVRGAGGGFAFRDPWGRLVPEVPRMPVRTQLAGGAPAAVAARRLDSTKHARDCISAAPHARLDLGWAMRTLYRSDPRQLSLVRDRACR